MLPLPPLLPPLLLPCHAHSRCCSLPALACWPAQVQTKLKLVGIAAVYLASSGEQVTRLDQLQDIDELYVVEVSGRPFFIADADASWLGLERRVELQAIDGLYVVEERQGL